jgi:hypothetical protein
MLWITQLYFEGADQYTVPYFKDYKILSQF